MDKYSFISDIMKNKSLTHSQKERMCELIAKELRANEFKNSEISKKINNIEKKLAKDFENKSKDSSSKGAINPHKPLDTVEFLKNFKYDNDTGLKELVHKPRDEGNYDLQRTLTKVKNHPNLTALFSDGYDKENKLNKWISSSVRNGTKKLIEIIEREGLPFNQRTGKHPMEDNMLATKIQNFKRNYRFGGEKSEASILRNLIDNILNKLCYEDKENSICYSFGPNDSSAKFSLSQIKYKPDSNEIFQIYAQFFTWIYNIKNYIWWVFESILKHSNVLGNYEFFKNEKDIYISVEREFNQLDGHTEIHLRILDNKSYLLKQPDQFLEELKNSSEYKWRLRGLADWQINCYHQEKKGMTFNILSKKDPNWHLNKNIGKYFEHIVTFYE